MKRLIALLLLTGLVPVSTAALVTQDLLIHLDADTLTGTNGNVLQNWASTSNGSLSVTLTQGTSANRPVRAWNAINGHKAVDFTDTLGDGRNYMASGTWSWDASKGVTMIMVAQGGDAAKSTYTDTQNHQRAAQVGQQGAATPNRNDGKVLSAELASDTDAYNYNSGNRYNNGYTLTASGNNPLVEDEWHISFRQVAQGARLDQAFYSVNNLTNIAAVSNNPANTVNFVNDNNKIILGAAYISTGTAGEYYNGQIAEVLIYNGVLTEAQMAEIGNYLSDKYAIAFVPEPATLVLLGLGSLLAVRCRKA